MQKGTHNAHKCNFRGLTDKTHANSTVQPSYLLPVKLTPLVKFLVSYPPGLVTYITSSFSMDFSLHFQGCRSFLIPNNLTSALENICRQKNWDRNWVQTGWRVWLNFKENTWQLQVNSSFLVFERHIQGSLMP